MNGIFHWKHKNLLLFIVGLLLAWFFSQNKWVHDFLIGLGGYGYFSAILAGALFVSTFTMATAVLILATLASSLSPIEIVLLGGVGAVLTDILIFRFAREGIDQEIEPIYKQITGGHLKKLLHTKYFGWTLPVLGTLIITQEKIKAYVVESSALLDYATFKIITSMPEGSSKGGKK